jgi:tetratricopeptide (TPR) repeat protein
VIWRATNRRLFWLEEWERRDQTAFIAGTANEDGKSHHGTLILNLVFLVVASLPQVACGERVVSSHRGGSRNVDAAQDGGDKATNQEVEPQRGSGEDHYNLANELSNDREADEALKEYNLALQAGYDTADLRVELGLLLGDQLKRYPEACEQLRVAAEREPTNLRAHSGLGTFLLLDGRYEEALAELTIADKLDRDSRSYPYYSYEKAKALDALQRYQEALDEYNRFLTVYGNLNDDPEVIDSKERVRAITEQLKLER